MTRHDPTDWLDGMGDDEPPSGADPNRKYKLLIAVAVPWLALPVLVMVINRWGDADAATVDPPTVEAIDANDEQGLGDADGYSGQPGAPDGAGTDVPDDPPADTGIDGVEPDDDTTGSDDASAGPGDDAPVEPSNDPGPGADPGGADHGGTVPGDLAASAVLAVRQHLTRTGDEPAYVDLATAEAVEQVGPAAVVRVAAVVLTGDEEAWTETSLRRLAVPLDDAAEPLAAPWPLAAPLPLDDEADLPTDAFEWPTPGDESGVEEALLAQGFSDVEDLVVAEDPALADVRRARFQGAHGDEPATNHEVWLGGEPPLPVGGKETP